MSFEVYQTLKNRLNVKEVSASFRHGHLGLLSVDLGAVVLMAELLERALTIDPNHVPSMFVSF